MKSISTISMEIYLKADTINDFFMKNTDPLYDTVEKYIRWISPFGTEEQEIKKYIDIAENNMLIHKLEQMEL